MLINQDIPAVEKRISTALRQQNEIAIDLLYQHYASALYGVVMRIVQSDEIAEDVMQESFVKVWQKGEQYDSDKGRLFTWLVNIFRNAAIDKVRSKGFRKAKQIQTDENAVINIENPDKLKPELIGIADFLEQLSPEQQQIIDLVYLQGYTHREVADEYDIPLGTVKTRVRLGLKNLRALLAEEK